MRLSMDVSVDPRCIGMRSMKDNLLGHNSYER
jgi:hypothetical protein